MQKSLWVFVEATNVMLIYGLAYKYTITAALYSLYKRKCTLHYEIVSI